MQVATSQPDGKIKLTTQGWTLVLAIVAIVPPLANAGIDYFMAKPATIRVENEKLDLERHKTATALYQAVLANSDAAKRKQLLVFLVDVGALKDDNNTIRNMTPDQIPQWAPTPSASGP
jgi:hypothetical protein